MRQQTASFSIKTGKVGFSKTFDQQCTHLTSDPGTDQVILSYYVPMHTTSECLLAFSHENYGLNQILLSETNIRLSQLKTV